MTMSDDHLEQNRLSFGLNRYGCWVYCLFDTTFRHCSGLASQQSISRQRAEHKARKSPWGFKPNQWCIYDLGERATEPLRKAGAACPNCGAQTKRLERTWETACTLDAFIDLLVEHAQIEPEEEEETLANMREWAAQAKPGAVSCYNNVMWCIMVDPAVDHDGLLDCTRGWDEWELTSGGRLQARAE